MPVGIYPELKGLAKVDVAIATNGTVSETLPLSSTYSIVAIETDSNFVAGTLTPAVSTQPESTSIGSVTFKTARDGAGAAQSYTCSPSSVALLSQSPMLVGNFYRFTAGATQTSGTTLTILYRAIG